MTKPEYIRCEDDEVGVGASAFLVGFIVGLLDDGADVTGSIDGLRVGPSVFS